jgi:uncharacterized LabA/DUF88 family protein
LDGRKNENDFYGESMSVVHSEKGTVFIDGGYFDNVLKNLGKLSIDFEALANMLCNNCERLRTYYYSCMPYQSNPPTDDEKNRYANADKFLYNIRKLPRFEVRLGKLSYHDGKFEQKRVDVLMSVDLVRMSWDKQIQRAFLVTGDSDFVPAVMAAKEAGVLVKVYYQQGTIHDELYDACDDREELTKAKLTSVLRYRKLVP